MRVAGSSCLDRDRSDAVSARRAECRTTTLRSSREVRRCFHRTCFTSIVEAACVEGAGQLAPQHVVVFNQEQKWPRGHRRWTASVARRMADDQSQSCRVRQLTRS